MNAGLLDILTAFWGMLGEMAPYLLFGFAVAGALSVVISPATVERHLGGEGIWPIIKASLFGVPLPLCSCSVIPVAASLRRHGAGKGATTAFLLSTPQTGVDSIFATFSLLGPVFAVFRPVAAFVTGVFGGSLIEALDRKNTSGAAEEPSCTDDCCAHEGPQRSKWVRAFRHGFVVLPRDIGRPLLVGLVVAGAISILIPESFFADALGTGFLAMLVMMLLGIPVYVCATASIPVAAAMMMKGVSPGAALVFLMTGPATNAAAIATLWQMMGKRAALLYLAVVAITALGCGFTLDFVFGVVNISPGEGMPVLLPPIAKTVSAILLLLVLFPVVFHRKAKA